MVVAMDDHQKAYDQLGKLIGRWNTEGHIPAYGQTPATTVKGTDTYEWLPGGFFVLHTADVFIGNERSQTLEVIGFDKVRKHFTMQYYNNKGEAGSMTGTAINGLWTFKGDNLRFKGGFNSQENVFSGIWEQSSDGKTWTHFMNIKLVKTPAG